jgi:VWFA-related protein
MAIVITDGGDVTSFTDERDLIDLAARSGVAVFAVAITDGTTRAPVKPTNGLIFDALRAKTGGALTILQRDQDLSRTFIGAVDDFRTSYVLRYTPKSTRAVGWHDLSVKVTKRGRYTVRARNGYFDALVTTGR